MEQSFDDTFRDKIMRCILFKESRDGADKPKVEGVEMESQKKFKRGEVLFKENDPIQSLWVLQSGKVSLYVERQGKRIEIQTSGPGAVFGEQGIFASARFVVSCEAAAECKVMEVPIEIAKAQMAQSSSLIKVLNKSWVDEIKVLSQHFRSHKLENDKNPCPQPSIPRVFNLLHLLSRHIGVSAGVNSQEFNVDWGLLKLNTSRLFSEPVQRVRGVCDLLTKLGFATLEMGKNDEGEEELKKVKIHSVKLIEDFVEFYQYNLYKGTHSEMIHVDPLAMKVALNLSLQAEGQALDRHGAVTLVWEKVQEEFKKRMGNDLKTTHLDALEKKGLFVKRVNRDGQPPQIQFDQNEFKKVAQFWQIISEIDKWNEKGFVEMVEKPIKPKSGLILSCDHCQGELNKDHKFCPHCGHKVGLAA